MVHFPLSSSVNCENKVGAVGFTTRIAPMLYPVTLVKIDPVTGEPVRDKNGVCVHAQPGELLCWVFFFFFYLWGRGVTCVTVLYAEYELVPLP